MCWSLYYVSSTSTDQKECGTIIAARKATRAQQPQALKCEAMPLSTRRSSIDPSVSSGQSVPGLPVASELQLHEQDDLFQHILSGLLPAGAAYHDPALAGPAELPFPEELAALHGRPSSQAASTSVSACFILSDSCKCDQPTNDALFAAGTLTPPLHGQNQAARAGSLA